MKCDDDSNSSASIISSMQDYLEILEIVIAHSFFRDQSYFIWLLSDECHARIPQATTKDRWVFWKDFVFAYFKSLLHDSSIFLCPFKREQSCSKELSLYQLLLSELKKTISSITLS